MIFLPDLPLGHFFTMLSNAVNEPHPRQWYDFFVDFLRVFIAFFKKILSSIFQITFSKKSLVFFGSTSCNAIF